MPEPDVQEVIEILRAEHEDGLPELDRDTVQRVLTEPQQRTLAEALSADAADVNPISPAVPIFIRWSKANQRGLDYGNRPEWVDDAIAELPYPWNEIGDMVININTLAYLSREYDVDMPEDPQRIIENTSMDIDGRLDSMVFDKLPGQ